jgi:hypothetical protein
MPELMGDLGGAAITEEFPNMTNRKRIRLIIIFLGDYPFTTGISEDLSPEYLL